VALMHAGVSKVKLVLLVLGLPWGLEERAPSVPSFGPTSHRIDRARRGVGGKALSSALPALLWKLSRGAAFICPDRAALETLPGRGSLELGTAQLAAAGARGVASVEKKETAS
jgi:hypothetical protein